MGSRSLGELLLRPSSLHTLPIPQITCPILRRTTTLCLSQRSFSNSIPMRSTQPQRQPDPEPSDSSDSSSQPNTNEELGGALDDFYRSSRRPASNSSTSNAIDSIFQQSGMRVNRQSPPSSSDAFETAHRQFGMNFSKPINRLRPRGLDIGAMEMGDSFKDEEPLTPAPREEDIKYPRLNASYGRTVKLDPAKGRDIVRGLGMLGSLITRNRVKNDFHRQKFHERPGLKRKRLHSERWRARFKVGFDGTCKRVTELTKKGW